jgi:hypothetical protein
MRPAGGCAAVCRYVDFVKVDVLRGVTPFRRILLLPSLAVESSLTLAHFWQITRRHISQQSNIFSHRHENHKYGLVFAVGSTRLNFQI